MKRRKLVVSYTPNFTSGMQVKFSIFVFRDVYCGLLQCKHYNERLEFGMESVAIISHSFMTSENGTTIIPCRTAIVDFGLNVIDPGLAPDGAKCAENHVNTFNELKTPQKTIY